MKEKDPADDGQSVMRYSTGGVFDDVERLARAIKSLGEHHNLIVPGGAIGTKMPLLHAAGISFVFPDPEKESYAIVGKPERGLGKTALNRIARGAGVRWMPSLCGRLDNGMNPYVVEYQAVGTVLQLDGTEATIRASKRIDLRAEKEQPVSTWGADAQEIYKEAEKKTPAGEEPNPWPRILQQRQQILSLAETKAMNRAIRTLGVKTSYPVADIEKGFAIVKLQFTGRSDDPEVEREVSLMIARRALSSTSALYGGETPAQLAPVQRVAKVTPVEEEEEAEDKKPENGKAAPAAAPATKTEAAKPAAPPPAACERVKPKDDPLLICGDKDPKTKQWPRKPCSEFDAEVLKAKIFAAERNRSNWDPQWVDKNEAELKAMKEWRAYKEFDPRQGTLPGVDRKSDEVPF